MSIKKKYLKLKPPPLLWSSYAPFKRRILNCHNKRLSLNEPFFFCSLHFCFGCTKSALPLSFFFFFPTETTHGYSMAELSLIRAVVVALNKSWLYLDNNRIKKKKCFVATWAVDHNSILKKKKGPIKQVFFFSSRMAKGPTADYTWKCIAPHLI